MKYIIDLVYLLGVLLYSPKVLYRRWVHGRYKGGWGQRLGRITRRNPDKPCIWIHAVSVGEVNATWTLVEAIQQELPDYEIAISATTDTGLARAKTLYDHDHTVFYFPFDLSWLMKRAFTNIRPSIILLMELEVWPNLSSIAQSEQVPVFVINGRISDRSFPRYKLIKGLIRPMFSKLTMALAQTEEYAERFRFLGCDADKVCVTSSLKYDTAQTAGAVAGADRVAEQINLEADRLWVVGGSGPGEEQIALDVFTDLKKDPAMADLRLAIVPRKPERFDEVAGLIEESRFDFVRFSQLKQHDTRIQTKPEIILGDTMGDLKKFYAISHIVFVGRSLVPMGGSDMMEPTGLGKCTLFGPETFNFKQTVEVLLDGRGAIEVKDQGQLYEQMLKCLTDKEFARHIARNGQAVICRNQGATDKTIAAIKKVLRK